jgi:1-phosphofructokinase family hexose kinase
VPVKQAVVVSANTALDVTLLVDGFHPGAIHDLRSAREQAGGKGINVARALLRLGGTPLLAGFLGGATGARVHDEITSLKIAARWVATGRSSRTCYIVVDRARRQSTVLNGSGPSVDGDELAALDALLLSLMQPDTLFIFSGSLPPGVPDDAYANWITRARGGGALTALDASGPPLALALEAQPWLVKVTQAEYREATGRSDDPVGAATWLLRQGIAHAVVTVGAEGFAYAGAAGHFGVRPPVVETLNAVGSGDTLLAGIAAAILRGQAMPEALRLGAAAAAANAAALVCDLAEAPPVESLVPQVVLDISLPP